MATFAELQSQCDILLDKAGTGSFTTAEWDLHLTNAQMEIVRTRAAKFEADEATREDLLPLVQLHSAGTTSTIDLSAIGVLRVLNLRGTFSIPCGDSNISKTVMIRPVQLDDRNAVLQDPFNKPTDEYPLYEQIDSEIRILSTNTPTGVVMAYLAIPQDINAAGNPTGTPDLPVFLHPELVRVAVRMAKENLHDESYGTARVEVAESEGKETR